MDLSNLQKYYPNLRGAQTPMPTSLWLNHRLPKPIEFGKPPAHATREPLQPPLAPSDKIILTKTHAVVTSTTQPTSAMAVAPTLAVEPVAVPEPIKTVKPKPKPKKKMDDTQRKQKILEQLARRPAKQADQEINKIQSICHRYDHDPNRIKLEEANLRKKINLINKAKYFTNPPENPKTKKPSKKKSAPVKAPSPSTDSVSSSD